jgi:hypothetical protein
MMPRQHPVQSTRLYAASRGAVIEKPRRFGSKTVRAAVAASKPWIRAARICEQRAMEFRR